MKTIDFSSYSSIKIGPKIDITIIDEVQDCSSYVMIGGANNLLVPPNPPKIAILGKNFDFIEMKDSTLHIGGATKSGKILSYAKKHNISNFEFMQKLPGTLGGMIKMNAGLKEWEIFNHLLAVKTEFGWIDKKDIEFGYRFANIKGVIFEAAFKISPGFSFSLLDMFKKLRDNQPKFPSAGSCFKNPPNNYAGKLLDEAGLKGYKIGDMAFSTTHANFLINLGDGTFSEAVSLIKFAKSKVYEKFGITLETEIEILPEIDV